MSDITIGSDGLPIIAYIKETAAQLWVAHCNDVACAGNDEELNQLDPLVAIEVPSLAISANGLPIIAYEYKEGEGLDPDLAVIACDDVACAGAETRVEPVAFSNRYPQLNIGTDGLPMLLTTSGSVGGMLLRVCSQPHDCASSTPSDITVDGIARFATFTIGVDGLPIIAFSLRPVLAPSTPGPLTIVHCNDASCSDDNESKTILDPDTDVGKVAMTIGVDGLPFIAYHDITRDDLRVLHCSNPWCTPYFRRP